MAGVLFFRPIFEIYVLRDFPILQSRKNYFEKFLEVLIMPQPVGIVYLIHLSEPMSHSQHYIGWTSQTLPKRLEQHRKGQGAHFLKIASNRGIKLLLVRVWSGTRRLERKLKNGKYGKRICPLCNRWDKVCHPKVKTL